MIHKFNILTRGTPKKSDHLSDEKIIEHFKTSHDLNCIGQLFERYTHLVFGLCMKYLKSEAEAEDATLQIFEELFDKLDTHEITNFKSWLYSVAKNHCLMYLRKQKTDQQRLEKYVKINQQEDVDLWPEIHLLDEDENQKYIVKLKSAIDSLNNEQKCCIQLMYFENRSYQEIAETTGYSLKKVKSYIQNGKRNLKNQIIK